MLFKMATKTSGPPLYPTVWWVWVCVCKHSLCSAAWTWKAHVFTRRWSTGPALFNLALSSGKEGTASKKTVPLSSFCVKANMPFWKPRSLSQHLSLLLLSKSREAGAELLGKRRVSMDSPCIWRWSKALASWHCEWQRVLVGTGRAAGMCTLACSHTWSSCACVPRAPLKARLIFPLPSPVATLTLPLFS